MKMKDGDVIPGAEDYFMAETDEDWIVPIFNEYIEGAYENTWFYELFEQKHTDEKYLDLSPDKFAYNCCLSDGFEVGVDSIISAMSKAAYDTLTYEAEHRNWARRYDDNDERTADYYAMVEDFCDDTGFDSADFIVLDTSRVVVYAGAVGTELIKSDFTSKQFASKIGNEDIVQCHTHRLYQVEDTSNFRIYGDTHASDKHRKV